MSIGTHVPAPDLGRLPLAALIVGLAGAALCLLGALLSPAQFFRAYLVAYVFWWTIAVGCLGWATLYQLTGGMWGFTARPFFEAGAATLPLLALLFVPIAFGLGHIYEWTSPEVFQGLDPHHVETRKIYLEESFFLLRTAVYFAIWLLFGFYMTRPSRREPVRSELLTDGRSGIAAAGLIVMALTVTFAGTDWLMTLNPHWYSTIYGGMIAIAGLYAAMALTISMVGRFFVHLAPQRGTAGRQVLNDLGNLQLAFIMLWAYFQLSQFLIIWSGNLPEEAVWYLERNQNGWYWMAFFLFGLHFGVPFLLLLSRDLKRKPQFAQWIGIFLLVMHYFDLHWQIVPTWHDTFSVNWQHVTTLAGIGGLWVWMYSWRLQRRPWTLLPVEEHHFSPEVGAGGEYA